MRGPQCSRQARRAMATNRRRRAAARRGAVAGVLGERDALAEGCGDELAFHALLSAARSAATAQESLAPQRLNRSQFSDRLQSRLLR